MFFATVRFTVAKNPDKCPNLRTVGNYMGNCRKKRTSPSFTGFYVSQVVQDFFHQQSVTDSHWKDLNIS